MMQATCDIVVQGTLTEPAQARTTLDAAGQAHPVLCLSVRTTTGQLVKARQDYPIHCQDLAASAAKRLQPGARVCITFALHHAHLCADHAIIEPLPTPVAAAEPSLQQEIFA